MGLNFIRRIILVVFILSCMLSVIPITNFNNFPEPKLNNSPPNSASSSANFPLRIYPNNLTILPNENNTNNYMKVNSQRYPVLFEINKASYYKYMNLYFYTDQDYSAYFYSTNITQSNTLTHILIQNYTTSGYWDFFKIFGTLQANAPIQNSTLIAYQGNETLNTNTTYYKTISHNFPSIYYVNLTKGVTYRTIYNQTDEKDLQFNFYYAKNNTVTMNYNIYTLYNGGQFTPEISTLAMVLVRSYQEGTYNFTFSIEDIHANQTNTIIFTHRLILALILAPIVLVIIFEVRKTIKKRHLL